MGETNNVVMMGRLGNQLFQIATGLAHSKRTGRTLAIVPDVHTPSYIARGYLHTCGKWITTKHSCHPDWQEPTLGYTSIPPHARNLKGYFQTEKYFDTIRNDLYELFTLPESIECYAHSKWGDLISRMPALTVVHIRRGDYFQSAVNMKNHGFLTDKYYTRAMQASGAERVAIFSDDIEWCKRQSWLPHDRCEFIDESDEQIALYLMTKSKSFIISNSSFSWWAAYLSGEGARVWAPDRWYPRTSAFANSGWEDIYMSGWIKVPTD